MRFKVKTIKVHNKIHIARLSIYFKNYSIKIHLILNSDTGEIPHTHPWNFTSFLILPYKENLYYQLDYSLIGEIRYKPFNIVKKNCKQVHQVYLYKIFGIENTCSYCR